MNLRNRIGRLEKVTDSHGFCKCKSTPKVELSLLDLTEDAEITEQQLTGEPMPETCEICHKPIIKKVSVIQLVDAEV